MNKKNLKYYCIICDKKICYNTFKYGSKSCKSCSLKKAWKTSKQLKNRNQSKDRNPNWKDGICKKNYYCKSCGSRISYKGFKYDNGECKSCAHKGDKNSNYIDGRSENPYPLEFNDKLKLKIRTRDAFECQNCNMTEEEHLIVYGRVLEIHHIDYNKQNCEEKNLITACKQCNIRANYNREYWIEYFKEKIIKVSMCTLKNEV